MCVCVCVCDRQTPQHTQTPQHAADTSCNALHDCEHGNHLLALRAKRILEVCNLQERHAKRPDVAAHVIAELACVGVQLLRLLAKR